MRAQKIKAFSGAIALFVVAVVVIGMLAFVLFPGMPVPAAETVYGPGIIYSDSGALTDLLSASNFNRADFPLVESDSSIKVIQVWESAEGELLLYTYQPSGKYKDYKCSSVNISRQSDNAVDAVFRSYPLTFLNSDGVFYKYVVQDFRIEASDTRYYNISNILRPYDSSVDPRPAGSNVTTQTKNAVGLCWTVREVNGLKQYEKSTSRTIEIENKYASYFLIVEHYANYLDHPWDDYADGKMAYFVAFNTDKFVEQLQEVDMVFKLQSKTAKYNHYDSGGRISYSELYNIENLGDPYYCDPNPYTIRADQNVHTSMTGLGLFEYSFDIDYCRIEKTLDFLAHDYSISNEARTALNSTAWVLRYYETNWAASYNGFWNGFGEGFTTFNVPHKTIDDVEILRLKYKTDGVVYNLGTVDNVSTPDVVEVNSPGKTGGWLSGCSAPANTPEWAWELLKWLGIGTACIVGLILIIKFYPYIIKGLVWFILLPVRGIKAIIEAIRRKKDGGG